MLPGCTSVQFPAFGAGNKRYANRFSFHWPQFPWLMSSSRSQPTSAPPLLWAEAAQRRLCPRRWDKPEDSSRHHRRPRPLGASPVVSLFSSSDEPSPVRTQAAGHVNPRRTPRRPFSGPGALRRLRCEFQMILNLRTDIFSPNIQSNLIKNY